MVSPEVPSPAQQERYKPPVRTLVVHGDKATLQKVVEDWPQLPSKHAYTVVGHTHPADATSAILNRGGFQLIVISGERFTVNHSQALEAAHHAPQTRKIVIVSQNLKFRTKALRTVAAHNALTKVRVFKYMSQLFKPIKLEQKLGRLHTAKILYASPRSDSLVRVSLSFALKKQALLLLEKNIRGPWDRLRLGEYDAVMIDDGHSRMTSSVQAVKAGAVENVFILPHYGQEHTSAARKLAAKVDRVELAEPALLKQESYADQFVQPWL